MAVVCPANGEAIFRIEEKVGPLSSESKKTGDNIEELRGFFQKGDTYFDPSKTMHDSLKKSYAQLFRKYREARGPWKEMNAKDDLSSRSLEQTHVSLTECAEQAEAFRLQAKKVEPSNIKLQNMVDRFCDGQETAISGAQGIVIDTIGRSEELQRQLAHLDTKYSFEIYDPEVPNKNDLPALTVKLRFEPESNTGGAN